jgi:hypothetical protein
MKLNLRNWKFVMDSNYKPVEDLVTCGQFCLTVKSFHGSELWTLQSKHKYAFDFRNRLTIDLIKR